MVKAKFLSFTLPKAWIVANTTIFNWANDKLERRGSDDDEEEEVVLAVEEEEDDEEDEEADVEEEAEAEEEGRVKAEETVDNPIALSCWRYFT